MSEATSLALEDIEPIDRYKLLSALVVPRPIALVSSQNAEGVLNAAPYSFFNVFGEAPALVVLGIQNRPSGPPKDTAQNIRETGEFVVNLVDEQLAEGMNLCAADLDPAESEFDFARLSTEKSVKIKPPRIAEAPVSLECRKVVTMQFSHDRDLIVGEVVQLHARAGIVDSENFHVDLKAYRPIGRLFGSLYSYQRELFRMNRGQKGEPQDVVLDEL